MGVVLSGVVAAIVLAVGASYVMRAGQEPSWEVYSTGSTRVGEPGENLVGPDISGESGSAESGETPG